MRIIKRIGKCIIVYIVIFMTILSGISYGYTSEEVRGAVAGYARNFVTTGNEKEVLRYTLDTGLLDARWGSTEPNPDGNYYFCCATFVSWIYEQVAGYQIRQHGVDGVKPWAESNCIDVSLSEAQPGDILLITAGERGTDHGHTGILLDNNEIAHASTSQAAVDKQVLISPFDPSKWRHCYRLTDEAAAQVTNLNTEFSITGIGSGASSINYSNFFFNGIPDGKYSLASTKGIFSIIIDLLANILDYLIGILTYIVRIVFVGWTAIFDNLLNWTVNTVVDTGTTAPEAGLSPTETSGTETSDRSVTIESLLFNDFDILNINIFKTEETE